MRTQSITLLGDFFCEAPLTSLPPALGSYIVNLEGPISSRGVPAANKVNLRAGELTLPKGGTNRLVAASLANNHILDFGPEALRDTLDALDALGAASFGAGEVCRNYRNPAMVLVGATRVALLGYASDSTSALFGPVKGLGVARLELRRVVADIRLARSIGADRVFVCVHWGSEEVAMPNPADVRTVREIVEAGADLVVGHHPHVVQPWTTIDGRPVFFSLGNFAMQDLAVPSHYCECGVATRTYKKVQSPRNRWSAAVTVDPADMALTVRATRYDGDAVTWATNAPKEMRASSLLTSRYQRRFRIAYVSGKLWRLFHEFLAKPTFPRLRHFRALLNQITTRDFR